jgi:IS5 family transposase
MRDPGTSTPRGGFASAHNSRAAEALGVRRVVLSVLGCKSPPRRAHERQRRFCRGQRWRAECEGRISVVKRRRGLRRSRYRGAEGICRGGDLGVIADHLMNIAALPLRAERELSF